MTVLSRHFSLEEMLVSQTAARRGIDMTPPLSVRTSLRSLCYCILDPLRDALGVPIIVSSGYRPVQLNTLIGGVASSQHCKGEAADINVHGMTPLQLAERIVQLQLPFDQLIMEFGEWVHVSHKPFGNQRGEALTAKRVNGAAHYLPGLYN